MAVTTLVGCASEDDPHYLPRVKEGTASDPAVIRVVWPDPDPSGVVEVIRSRDTWTSLEGEVLFLSDAGSYPQPAIPAHWRAAGEKAVADLVDPLARVDVRFGSNGPVSSSDETLVVVEMLPADVIRARHGSDAFTESFYQQETLTIRRAVVRLPLWLLEEEAADFANFVAHEFGHALGYGEHLADIRELPKGEPWFWDRLMTVPIRTGQTWQPATSDDILAIATGRYTLREGWMAERDMRFAEAIPTYAAAMRTRPAVQTASR